MKREEVMNAPLKFFIVFIRRQIWPLLSLLLCYVEGAWREKKLWRHCECLKRPWRRTKISSMCVWCLQKKPQNSPKLFYYSTDFYMRRTFLKESLQLFSSPLFFSASILLSSFCFNFIFHSLATNPELKIIHFRHRETKTRWYDGNYWMK